MALRSALKSVCVVSDWRVLRHLKVNRSSLPLPHVASRPVTEWSSSDAVRGNISFPRPPVRHYAQAPKKEAFPSQLSDLPPTALKTDYATVPLAQTTDDLVKRLLTLELASHVEKLNCKKEQLIAMVQREETDRSSPEVRVAVLTARIRNYQEHLHKHAKDKANKRRMLLAIDRRKKMLKIMRQTNYEAFENVCHKLGITYTFPPEYYRRATKRWVAKKALCIKVYQEVQRKKAEQREKERRASLAESPGTTE